MEGLAFDAVLTSEDVLRHRRGEICPRPMGLSIPGDLSIVGYNNSNYCLCCDPEMTSVDNKLRAICDHCVETMLGVLNGRDMPQKTVFTGELIRRGSTL